MEILPLVPRSGANVLGKPTPSWSSLAGERTEDAPTDITMDSPTGRLLESNHSERGAISAQASFPFMAPCKEFSIV